MSASGRLTGRRLLLVVPLLLAFGVHVPALGLGFTWDDVPHVAEDPRLREPLDLSALVTTPYLTGELRHQSPWRPATTLSYALCQVVGDGDPFPFHLFNVVAHVLATALVVSLLLPLGAGTGAAALAASFFAVHPVHVEAVVNVVGRGDVLMTAATLAGVRLYVARGVPLPFRVAGVAAAYLLALGSKESGIVLPALLVLVEVLRPPRADASAPLAERLRASLPIHAALAAVLAAYLLARVAVLGSVVHADVATYVAALPTSVRITTAVANVGELARLLLFPRDLSMDYGPAVILPAHATDVRFLAGLAVAVGSAALAWIAWRDREAEAWTPLALAWVAATWLLVSNLVMALPMWMAERTLYLPSVGVALLVVGVVEALRPRPSAPARRGARRAVLAAACAVVLLGSWHTVRRTTVWTSNEALLTDMVERHPESFRALWWVGNAWAARGRTAPAVERLGRAWALNPGFSPLGLDYARVLLWAGRLVEAEEVARRVGPAYPERWLHLAESLRRQGRAGEARRALDEGLSLFPDDPELGAAQRRLDGAEGSASPMPPPGFEPGT